MKPLAVLLIAAAAIAGWEVGKRTPDWIVDRIEIGVI